MPGERHALRAGAVDRLPARAAVGDASIRAARRRLLVQIVGVVLMAAALGGCAVLFWWWAVWSGSPWTPTGVQVTVLVSAVSATQGAVIVATAAYAMLAAWHSGAGRTTSRVAVVLAVLHLAAAVATAVTLWLAAADLAGVLAVGFAAVTLTQAHSARQDGDRYRAVTSGTTADLAGVVS